MMTRKIFVQKAESPNDLQEIYRFRYKIYVEEMNRIQHYADHKEKIIIDPLDECGHNFFIRRDEEIVGVVRVNLSRDGQLGTYEPFYDMASAGSYHPAQTSIVTRLMVSPKYRRTIVPAELSKATYVFGLENKVQFCFIDCNDHLVGFFRHMGFIAHLPKADHPEYGNVTRMRLDLRDEQNLLCCKSPFIDLLKSWRDQEEIEHGKISVK